MGNFLPKILFWFSDISFICVSCCFVFDCNTYYGQKIKWHLLLWKFSVCAAQKNQNISFAFKTYIEIAKLRKYLFLFSFENLKQKLQNLKSVPDAKPIRIFGQKVRAKSAPQAKIVVIFNIITAIYNGLSFKLNIKSWNFPAFGEIP